MPDQMLEQILKEISEARRDLAVQSVELAKNTVETKNAVDQLVKLNGTVARHERENITFTASIKALESFKQSQEAKDSGKTGRTQMFVDKLLWGVIGIAGRFSKVCVSGDNQPFSLERTSDYATDPTGTAR